MRAILDDQGWTRNVHDFMGVVVDILDEQYEPPSNDDPSTPPIIVCDAC